ncbi:uncharacterized protein LOC110861167 isoform X3 [Folsomia candida]|uniref:uncharacterized protein LOC110861167 isoform X3 n=1 Tax=Folsomia candida TaxID=158441 RepID=UPI000B8EFE28|nr:uncharacterized protein LOC110861167 isoform X3 [Folsomia candida]
MSTEGHDCCLFCGTDSNVSTRMGNEKSRSLHVISILHKLLQIPILECGKYLDFPSSSFPSPETDWLILCTSCSSIVAQGHAIALQLDLLHDQLAKIQTTLQNQIVNPPKEKNFITKVNAEIVDQLKQDISRRRDPDNMNSRPIAIDTFSNAANVSSPEEQGSIDDMNLGILVANVKVEDPQINLDDGDDDFDFSINPVTVQIGDDAESSESGDDECKMDNKRKVTNIHKPRKVKIVRNPCHSQVTKKVARNNTKAKEQKQTRIKEYNANTDYSTASVELVETMRGNPKLRVNGYSYTSAKFGSSKRIWICDRQRSNNCNARLHTSVSLSPITILGELRTHNHGPRLSSQKS